MAILVTIKVIIEIKIITIIIKAIILLVKIIQT